MKKNQIINPLIRFRRKAQGRYANNLGGAYGRAVTVDETQCFYIVSAHAGDPSADWWTVCFNTVPEEVSCLTLDFDFRNLDNVNPLIWGAGNNPGGNCLQWEKGTSSENDSSAPGDELVLDYTPGSCRKDLSTEDECLLDAYSGYPVTNNIYGPIALRVGGELPDNVVGAYFPSNVAQIGSTTLTWEIKVQGVQQTISSAQIVNGNRIEFTIGSNVSAGDTVVISHKNVSGANACQATDGRYCWRFYDQAVVNSVGDDFRILADGGFRLLGAGTDARVLV